VRKKKQSGGTAMPTTQGLTPLEAVNEIRNNNNGQIVLVLQGGGALGAYQGGVYQALHEAGVEPDWLIGTSIGAINASLIAGTRTVFRSSKNSGGACNTAPSGGRSRPGPASPKQSRHGRR
jgi:hypothetical protein